jgi:hypothetical protein
VCDEKRKAKTPRKMTKEEENKLFSDMKSKLQAAQEILERLDREDGLEASEYAASLMEVVRLHQAFAEEYQQIDKG